MSYIVKHLHISCLFFLLSGAAFSQATNIGANPLEQSPATYTISSPFGLRVSPFTGEHELHHGLDIPSQMGSPILATGDGIVTYAAYAPGYGNLVEIDHGQGYTTRYGHAQTLLVKIGDLIQQSQKIATVGSTGNSTGPHLHFETSYQGKPFDPLLLLGGQYTISGNRLQNSEILVFTSTKLKAPWQLTQYAAGKIKPQILYISKNTKVSGQPVVIVRSHIQGPQN
ncbi:M23 family metallopeptidase [Polynucleobacter asymbioticus]|uniref:M23 family metallopeptidase n=1 Tax=Polynucleobacter asymbioticus TaxID=576611 RepID=UPI0009C1604B|nr:M23 family metallopeptidase [Polynucleobacter asymbioticus]